MESLTRTSKDPLSKYGHTSRFQDIPFGDHHSNQYTVRSDNGVAYFSSEKASEEVRD